MGSLGSPFSNEGTNDVKSNVLFANRGFVWSLNSGHRARVLKLPLLDGVSDKRLKLGCTA